MSNNKREQIEFCIRATLSFYRCSITKYYGDHKYPWNGKKVVLSHLIGSLKIKSSMKSQQFFRIHWHGTFLQSLFFLRTIQISNFDSSL